MRFTPKTEAELEAEAAARGPLPAGVYDFEFVAAEEKLSKAGNEMIEVELKVFDGEGGHRKVRDWLVSTLQAKVRHACYSVGLGKEYEEGGVEAHQLLYRAGKVKLAVRKEGDYPPKNVVSDYVVDAERSHSSVARPAQQSRQPAMAGNDLDDEIPF